MNIAWVSHLPEDRRQAFKDHVLNESKNAVLIRLREIIEEKRRRLEVSERSTQIYESPNWAYLQAHNNGMLQAVKLIEDLLNFTKG